MPEGTMHPRKITTTCCIAGGGPAGMMLGFLLARAGIDVTVVEKHSDFLRDFRGDTIHPSTLEVMKELGLLDRFLARPHEKAFNIHGQFGDETLMVADFTHLPVTCGFIAFMPQWEFLDFLADEARAFPNFTLLRSTEATNILSTNGTITGLECMSADGPIKIEATLTVAADGRGSTVRQVAGMVPQNLGAPMDVLWMHIPKRGDEQSKSFGRFDAGRILILIDRNTYWQAAFVIPKGGLNAIKARGLEAFRAEIMALSPALADNIDALASWDDIKLLTVAVDRLHTWHKPGLLVIGDAAHAMSPVGGVGINLAIQDAVATANLLHDPLRRQCLTNKDLAAVQSRRMWPTKLTQAAQVAAQNRVIAPALASGQAMKLPLPLRILKRFPVLARIPARLIGMGVRPEHVHSPAISAR